MNREGLAHVVCNMREIDRQEVFATTFPHDNPAHDNEAMIERTFRAGTEAGIGFIAYSGEEPVAVIGMTMAWPGVVGVWMFATDSWPLVALGLTRWARKSIIPIMRDAEVHRAQCWSMSGHHVAHRWLKYLGATLETVAPGFGREGEEFCLFAWVRGRNF